jgi:membrane-associated HD superfamily phosphohydrolase
MTTNKANTLSLLVTVLIITIIYLRFFDNYDSIKDDPTGYLFLMIFAFTLLILQFITEKIFPNINNILILISSTFYGAILGCVWWLLLLDVAASSTKPIILGCLGGLYLGLHSIWFNDSPKK